MKNICLLASLASRAQLMFQGFESSKFISRATPQRRSDT